MSQEQIISSANQKLYEERLEKAYSQTKDDIKIQKNPSNKPVQSTGILIQAYKLNKSEPTQFIQQEESIQEIFDSQMSKLVDLVNSVLDNSFNSNSNVQQEISDINLALKSENNELQNQIHDSEQNSPASISYDWGETLSLVQIIVVQLFQEKKQKQEKKSKRVEEKQKMFFKKAFKYVENQYFSQKLQKKKIQKRFKDYDDFYTYFFQESANENKMDITQFYHPQKTTTKIRAQGQRSFNQVYIDLLLTSYKFRQEIKKYLYDTFFQEITLERNQKIEKFLQKCFQKVENQIKSYQQQNGLQDFPKSTLKALFTPKSQLFQNQIEQIPIEIKKMIEECLKEYIIKNPKSKIPWSVAELRETKDFAQNYIESFENQISQQKFPIQNNHQESNNNSSNTNSNAQFITQNLNNKSSQSDSFHNYLNSNIQNQNLQNSQTNQLQYYNTNPQIFEKNLIQNKNNTCINNFPTNSNNFYIKPVQSQSTIASVKHSNNNTTNTSFASNTANPDHYNSTEDFNYQNTNQHKQQNYLVQNNSSYFNNQIYIQDKQNLNSLQNNYQQQNYENDFNQNQNNRVNNNLEFQVPINYIPKNYNSDQNNNFNFQQQIFISPQPKPFLQAPHEFQHRDQAQQPQQQAQSLQPCCNCQNNQNQNFIDLQKNQQIQHNMINTQQDINYKNQNQINCEKLQSYNDYQSETQNEYIKQSNPCMNNDGVHSNQYKNNHALDFDLKKENTEHIINVFNPVLQNIQNIQKNTGTYQYNNDEINLQINNSFNKIELKEETQEIEEEQKIDCKKLLQSNSENKNESLQEQLKKTQQQEEEDQINNSQTKFQETIDKYFDEQQQKQLQNCQDNLLMQEQEQNFNTYNSLSMRNQVRAIDQEIQDHEQQIQIQNEEDTDQEQEENDNQFQENNSIDMSDQDDYKEENEDNRIKIQRGKKIKIKSDNDNQEDEEEDKIIQQNSIPQNNENGQLMFNQEIYDFNPVRTDFSKPIKFNVTMFNNQSFQEGTQDGPQKSLFNLQSTSNIFKSQSHYSQQYSQQ